MMESRVMPSRMAVSGGVLITPLPDDEEVFAGRFADVAVGVEHQGFVITVLFDFHLGEHGVHIVAAALALLIRVLTCIRAKELVLMRMPFSRASAPR